MNEKEIGWVVTAWRILQTALQLYLIWLVITLPKWKKLLPFLKHESGSSLERKLFSFDEAYLPKLFTDNFGVITNVNKAAERLLGWKEEDLINKNYEILIPERDRAALKTQLTTDDEEHEERTFFTNALHKNRHEIPVEVVFRKKRLNEDLFYLVVIRDRTQEVIKIRKFEQYIEILKLKVDILSRGEQIANTGSWLWDLRSEEREKAITASENYKRIVGLPLTQSSYSIQNIKPRVWPDDMRMVDEAIDKAINEGKDYDIKYRLIRSNDLQVVHIRSQARVFKDEDGVVVALSGVATLLKTENLSEASKVK